MGFFFFGGEVVEVGFFGCLGLFLVVVFVCGVCVFLDFFFFRVSLFIGGGLFCFFRFGILIFVKFLIVMLGGLFFLGKICGCLIFDLGLVLWLRGNGGGCGLLYFFFEFWDMWYSRNRMMIVYRMKVLYFWCGIMFVVCVVLGDGL